MKKTILLLFLAAIRLNAADADFIHGVDFTGRSNPPAVLFNQLVDRATPNTNKGMVLVTNGTPAGRSAYTNWVWLDKTTDPPTLKVYYSASGTWVAATIADGSVTTTKLADGAVSKAKLGAASVSDTNIVTQSILSGNIAPANIISNLIASSNIFRVHIAYGAVDGPQITNSAVGTAQIADGAVTPSKLSAPISSTNIAANAINATNMQINSVRGSNIVANAIAATNITDGIVTTNKLAFWIASYTNMVTNALPSPAGNVSFTHGLGAAPSAVRVVLVCNNASGDAGTGAALGDEIEITSCRPNGTSDPLVQVYCTATTVSIVRADGTGVWRVAKKSTGVLTAVTAEANFVLRVRAWYQP